MKGNENQIVVYQPDEVMRLEVRLENETVWLTQSQMAELFGCTVRNIRLHLENIYNCGELEDSTTRKDFFLVRMEGSRKVSRQVACYNLDAIISVGYRVNSVLGVRFRQWATGVLRDYLLKGYAVNSRLAVLEDKVDRRLAKHDDRIAALEQQVDFFVKTNTPPPQGIFYEGQLWDACSFVENLIAKAKSSILLIDSWVDVGTLDMLAKKRKGVAVEVVASKRGNKLAATDVMKFNTQYGPLTLKESAAFHDRFLILDDKELYLIGASLKDLGKKCFGFTKMDAGEIPGIKARV
ncbi:MAG: RhuM family protein [Kiritimatiellia bacterium]|nr:RhuM family protein [Kiritimatiellia bacterium]